MQLAGGMRFHMWLESRKEAPGSCPRDPNPTGVQQAAPNANSSMIRLGQLLPHRPPGVPMPTDVAATVPDVSVPNTATISPGLTLANDGEVTSRSR